VRYELNLYIQAKRGIILWKIGAWTLKDIRGRNAQGISLIRSKNENWNRLLKREETNVWRDLIFCKRFRSIDAEICIRWIAEYKNKTAWKKAGIRMIKKLKRIEVKFESKVKAKETLKLSPCLLR
jgi:hypothetical protein